MTATPTEPPLDMAQDTETALPFGVVIPSLPRSGFVTTTSAG